MMKRARNFYDSMFPLSLMNEIQGSALSWGLSLPTMFQQQVPSYPANESWVPEQTPIYFPGNSMPCNVGHQENDFTEWVDNSELNDVDLTWLDSNFHLTNTASFEFLQALQDASDQQLFLQST